MSKGLLSDLFRSSHAAPVAGGTLAYGQAGTDASTAYGVVLALHGITGNRMAWRSVARALAPDSRVCMIAPDLRGRADSAALPGPYGIAAHVADVLAVLDHAGVARAILTGHSMGAYVAARLAAEHPDRVVGLVLVDGGVPLRGLDEETAAAARAMLIGPAIARHAMTFSSSEAYVNVWRMHPALADAWNDDVEAYVLHDLGGQARALRYVVNLEAVEVDGEEMLSDRVNQIAIDRVRAPIHLLRAPRGVFNDDNPLIPQADLEAFVAGHPAAGVDEVPAVNHYTLLLGGSAGPACVAAAILAASRDAANA
jgi:pimeloyl-ACP methyl ester carboxylesterase